MDYSKTLNLPRTDFPMKAGLPQREPRLLEAWQELDIYRLVRQRRAGRPKFVLHDGPPYSNGDIHLGTAQNKVLKDITVKFFTLMGRDCPFVPGWDTHGLPLEHQVIKSLNMDRHELDPLEWRARCKEFALHFVQVQREQFKRLGCRGDWENPYLTLSPEYEARQIEVFGQIAVQGYIYRGLRPVYWCGTCETALADAEVEYADHSTPSITVRFPYADDVRRLSPKLGGADIPVCPISFLIWTTTPWTLPANQAIAVHPDAEYAVLRLFVGEQLAAPETSVGRGMGAGGASSSPTNPGEYVVIASELAAQLAQRLGGSAETVDLRPGRELAGLRCRHPFADRDSVVVLADYVSTTEGTGLVHIAPGHGEEDFATGVQYHLPVLSPLDDQGRLTEGAGPFAGKFAEEANPDIIRWLAEHGYLVHHERVTHQYPHCWRCKNPVLFRATEQWFVDMARLREPALRAVDGVRWVPAESKQRIQGMMHTRPDWCISRQRSWGVPLPIFYCRSCGEAIVTRESVAAAARLFRERGGSDAWWSHGPAEILDEGFTCPKCGAQPDHFRQEMDIMDVWFDSGTSYAGVLETDPDLGVPADLYLEGSDQHRGWFQSSLLTAVATRGEPPYRAVLTHGFVVDELGRKMSKSLGNTIDPMDIINRYGADILRLWVTTVDCKRDLHCSEKILEQVAETYRRIRNTCRFLLGNLHDFYPAKDEVAYDRLLEIDRWVLSRLADVIERVRRNYEDFDFHLVTQEIHRFCAVDLSAFYLDVLKDRLYVSAARSSARRSAQTALHHVLGALTRMLSPILTFTCEEIWGHRFKPALSGAEGTEDLPSVQLAEWPAATPEWEDPALEERYRRLLRLRDEVNKALEEAKGAGTIRQPLEAEVTLFCDAEVKALIEALEAAQIPSRDLFLVSRVRLVTGDGTPQDIWTSVEWKGLQVGVRPAPGMKCVRCWHVETDLGAHGDHSELCSRCAGIVVGLAGDDPALVAGDPKAARGG